MKCKYCEAELETENTVCPACGKDNAAAETGAPAAAQAAPEAKKSKLSTGKLIAIVCAAVVVLAVLAGVLIHVVRMDNVNYKSNYTADEEDLGEYRSKVVATMGDYELTNGVLQIYYWNQVYDFFDYAYDYPNLDFFSPLDEQKHPDGGTWQQYFLKMAIQTWQRDQAMAKSFEDAGMELDQEYVDIIDSLEENLTASAESYDFSSVEEMLAYDMGPGYTMEDYKAYGELYYKSYSYFSALDAELTASEEEMENYYQENLETFQKNAVDQETTSVNVRHILLFPEGGTTDDSGNTTYTEDEWEACRVKAQEIYDQWLAGDMTEDSFAALANEYSDDEGSNTDGGLYTNVREGTMVTEFNDWIFDESRQTGDHGLVKTEFGYHVMYYVGNQLVWTGAAEDGVLAQKQEQLFQDAQDANPVKVNYANVALGMATWHKQGYSSH